MNQDTSTKPKPITGTVGQTTTEESRWYTAPATGVVLESVTHILSAANEKPWLKQWAARMAAEFVADNIELVTDTLRGVGRDAAIDLIKRASQRSQAIARDIGSHQHHIVEALVIDTPSLPDVPFNLVDAEIDGETVDQDAISDGFLQFVKDFDPEFIMAEATVANPALGYAGTLDMVAYFPSLGMTGLVDVKTGKSLSPEANAQLAAYRCATEVWIDDLGNTAPMPQVDFAAVLHIRREYDKGYKLHMVPADDAAFDWFRHCQAVLAAQQAQPAIKGHPLYPPLPDGTQPSPLIEDLAYKGTGRYVKPLKAVGIRSVTDLACLTVTDVLTISGVGPGAIEPLNSMLVAHGESQLGEVR